ATVNGTSGVIVAFDYRHAGVKCFHPSGTQFTLEFHVPEKWQVTVQGRNLWEIFLHLHHQKLEWVEQANRDFSQGKDIIITSIRVD
ncbi:hypothetical protein Q8G41_28190, partial [Klebsiella pneumoniae]|uniref:hypothetical protein n=1 Tax=Klebsiella pneumoniae TaxID=573 RepID=UPI0030138FBC